MTEGGGGAPSADRAHRPCPNLGLPEPAFGQAQACAWGERRGRPSRACADGRRNAEAPGPPARGRVYIIPSVLGSQIDRPGQYVTSTRNTSMVRSQGHTATVSSVMPILAMPEAT